MKRRTRRNAPLTDAQASALRSILSAHSATPASVKDNPKRRSAKKAVRKHGKKRRISAAHRRILLKNLRKARAAKARKHTRRSRR
jgi:hypothetical protein